MFSDNAALALTPFEAEHYVETLDYLELEDVGSSKWLTQHEHIEKLNHLAHHQAKAATDEFVLDFLQTHDKIKVLIHDLILIEVWKEKLLPKLKSHIAPMSSLRNYIPVYHEASCINLLECALYQMTSCDAAGDLIVDLIDYIYRKLVYVVHTPNNCLWSKPLESAKEAGEWTSEQILDSQVLETEFQVSMCALSILRFITDHRSMLPITVTSRLMETHDILLLLSPLLDKAPWVRKRKGDIEKFEDQEWVKVPDEDIGQLPKLHSQVWLSIYNLVMDGECRARYTLTSFRKENLLRLRRYLNDIVFDQIPPLSNLLRTLEELSITGNFTGEQPPPTPFVVEVVAEIRERFLVQYKDKWQETADKLKKEVFTKETKRELDRMQDMIMVPDIDEYMCIKCGQMADMRCSSCKREWYCSRECQVSHWADHKDICIIHQKAQEFEQQQQQQKDGSERTEFDVTDILEECSKEQEESACKQNVRGEENKDDKALPLITEVH